MTISIRSGGLIIKGPNETHAYVADWDQEALPEGVELVDVGTFSVSPAGLTISDPELLAGNRTVQFTVSGGTRGTRYRVWHRVTTTDDPPETPERPFYILVQG